MAKRAHAFARAAFVSTLELVDGPVQREVKGHPTLSALAEQQPENNAKRSGCPTPSRPVHEAGLTRDFRPSEKVRFRPGSRGDVRSRVDSGISPDF
jgi:hypothetical protein